MAHNEAESQLQALGKGNGWEPLVCKFVDVDTTLEIVERASVEFGVEVEAFSNNWRDRDC